LVAISPVLLMIILVIGVTAVLLLRDRFSGKLALRSANRRKTTATLVVAGLLIGTAMISGSLVAGDTINGIFTHGTYLSFGAVDEMVYNVNARDSFSFFNYSVYAQTAPHLLGIVNVAGVTPMILSDVSLFDSNTRVGQPGVALVGVDANATSVLGAFTSGNGSTIDPDTGTSGVILNSVAAADLNASVGDSVRIITPTNSGSFTLIGIDQSFDRSGFPGDVAHAIISLSSAQSLLHAPSAINLIAITNSGGIQGGPAYSSQVGSQVNSTLVGYTAKGGGQLYAFGNKASSVTTAISNAQAISSFMLLASSFTIISGAVLIVNIFVMLAEERKKEMGMARAVGMNRVHLMKTFLFEGTLYGLMASAVGTFAGIAIAYVVIYSFGAILTGVASTINVGVALQSFTVSGQTLVTSFSAGLLITWLTVALASWRVSKLNIIRAIRDVPEPPASKRTYNRLFVAGALAVVAGAGLYFEGRASSNLLTFLVGPTLSMFGAGFVLAKFVRNRYAFTASSLAILLYWSYSPLSWASPLAPPAPAGSSAGFSADITGGVFMVASGVILAVFNTEAIVSAISKLFRGGAGSLAVARIGLSYPGSKKFRTGVTIFMVALIMFSVVFTSVLISINQQRQDQNLQNASDGYGLIASTSYPISDLAGAISRDSNVSGALSGVASFTGSYVTLQDISLRHPAPLRVLYLGANSTGPDNFFATNTFELSNATSPYLLSGGKIDARGVWAAVANNPDDVVLSTSSIQRGPSAPIPLGRAGDTLAITLPNGTAVNVTIIATMSNVALDGVISASQFVGPRLQTSGSEYALVSLANSGEGDVVAISLKRDFLSSSLQVTVIADLLAQTLSTTDSFYSLFQGFLALGLVVGVVGLSIISVRSVVERRQEIGMIRALGFTKRMVLGSFLLENSFVSVVGILIGSLLAVDLGYTFANSGSSIVFTPPYLNVVELMGVVYAISLLGSFLTALTASRTAPAEALRYSD
jgi:putative ABC transport system permease protein